MNQEYNFDRDNKRRKIITTASTNNFAMNSQTNENLNTVVNVPVSTIKTIDPCGYVINPNDTFKEEEFKFVIKVLSSDISMYNKIQRYLCDIYIKQEQYNSDPSKNILKLTEIVHDEPPKILYTLPENVDMLIKCDDGDVMCRLDRISGDHGISYAVAYLYALTIRAKSKDVIDTIITKSHENTESLTIYHYKSKEGYWKKQGKVRKRNMSTLIINNHDKNKLFKDIELFIKSKSEYDKYGIPYKRNYLFHGKPGTGKTSLANVIAHLTKWNMYIISFDAELTDGAFYDAVNNIDKESILLLEDIDCIFHSRDTNANNSNISFSALLNILDGVSGINNLLTIITTNHVNKLDKALLRPGRIDMMLEFTTISSEQIRGLLNLYKVVLDDQTIDEIMRLASRHELTTSVLSSFLFRHRTDALTCSDFLPLFNKYLTEIKTSLPDKEYENIYS